MVSKATKDARTLRAAMMEARRAKEALSDADSVEITLGDWTGLAKCS